MMGIPASQNQFVFDQTNVILGLTDPEYVAPGTNPLLAALNSGKALTELMNELAAARRREPKNDLTSQLLNAEIDGEGAHRPGARLVLRAASGRRQRDHAQRDQPRHEGAVRLPDERRKWAADFEGVAPTAVGGDRALGVAGDPLPAHLHAGHRARRSEAARGARRSCSGTTRPTATRRCSRIRTASTSCASRTSTSASGGPGAHPLSGCEPRAARDRGRVSRAAAPAARSRDHRRAGAAALELHPRHQAHAVRVHARGA